MPFYFPVAYYTHIKILSFYNILTNNSFNFFNVVKTENKQLNAPKKVPTSHLLFVINDPHIVCM